MTRAERFRSNFDTLQRCVANEVLDMKEISPYQFRLFLAKGTYDYYPVSGKINHVGTSKYEVIDLEKFVKGQCL